MIPIIVIYVVMEYKVYNTDLKVYVYLRNNAEDIYMAEYPQLS